MIAAITRTFDMEQIRTAGTAELRAELEDGLSITAQHLVYLAAIWRELESRGEDLTALRNGIAAYLPLIASGSVQAETVVMVSGNRRLMNAISLLPPNLQSKILADKTLPMVEYRDGEYTTRNIPLSAVTSSQIGIIFGKRCIRSLPEQIAVLNSPPTPWKPGQKVKRGNVVVDRKAGTVRIIRGIAPVQEVISALRAQGML